VRAIWSILVLLAWTGLALAQEPEQAPKSDGSEEPKEPPAKDDGGAAEQAKEPPVWVMPEKEHKKFEVLLEKYLHPGKKPRQEMLDGIQKFLEKPIDGHSALEDVSALQHMANQSREYNARLGRKGKVETVEVGPEVHGFPAGVGTVKYDLYLPNNYDPRKKLSPVIFCLPDNKRWPDGKRYIEQMWTKSSAVADEYAIVVPQPFTKSEDWSKPKSFERAMIALRHVIGTFDADKKTAGPAVDALRVFVDGGDMAATVAARFPEMLAGAILRGSDGAAPGEPSVRVDGALSGLAACCVYDEKKAYQRTFAERIKADNDRSLLVPVQGDADFAGDAEAIGKWMTELEVQTQPRSIHYMVHDPSFQRHFWINVLRFDAAAKPAASFKATANRATNEVRIELSGISRVELFLNDALVDLAENKKVRIVVSDPDGEHEFFNDVVTRDVGVLLSELVASNQPRRIYPVRFLIDVPSLHQREEAKKAAAAAKEGENAKSGESASMQK